MNHIKNRSCYFVSHLGLGDNITMSSAVRYLTNYYNKVYVIVKNIYYSNVQEFYEDNINIDIISINHKNEINEIKKIMRNLDSNIDVFVSGFCHKSYINNRITNDELNKQINNNNGVDFKYKFVVDFYTDINLNFDIYYNYFKLNENNKSLEIYNNIKNINLIFIHSKASNKEITINMNQFINDDNYLIVCANKNFYSTEHKNYTIANKYVNLPIMHYASIIKNAKVIRVIDSCFSCMILPLIKKNELVTNDIIIFDR